MTITPWKGKPTPRMCETPSGMLNAIGIQNKGVDHFISEDLPWLLKKKATVFASIAGNTVDEFVKVADKLRTGGRGIAAVEVNISCPNLEDRNNMFSHSVESTRSVVEGVKGALPRIPVFPKLSPNVTSHHRDRRGGSRRGGRWPVAGQHGVRHGDRRRDPPAEAGRDDGRALRPGDPADRGAGRARGPSAFPHVPIIGQGGVAEAEDALELILAGASAVAVGTMNFVDPLSSMKTIEGIAEYMERHDIESLEELVGSVKVED